MPDSLCLEAQPRWKLTWSPADRKGKGKGSKCKGKDSKGKGKGSKGKGKDDKKKEEQRALAAAQQIRGLSASSMR